VGIECLKKIVEAKQDMRASVGDAVSQVTQTRELRIPGRCDEFNDLTEASMVQGSGERGNSGHSRRFSATL
jgi:hypothetical protein